MTFEVILEHMEYTALRDLRTNNNVSYDALSRVRLENKIRRLISDRCLQKVKNDVAYSLPISPLVEHYLP